MKILVVDDMDENRYLLEALLKGIGHDVKACSNGADALERLKEGGYDLIVSDILMPVMDGFELCRKVKTDESLRHIPFVFYTATYTDPQDEAFAAMIGADRFIVKPCEPDIFVKALNETVAAAGQRGKTKAPVPVKEEEILKLYNERLIQKLENKMTDLEKEIRLRQKAEETLRESERKYRVLTDNSLDVIWSMNTDLVFTYVNPAICRVTGYSPEEWTGSRLHEHMHKEDYENVIRVIADETARGAGSHGVIWETLILKKNGEPVPVEINGRVIFGTGMNPIAIQGVARDITERKRAEEELRRNQSMLARTESIAHIGSWEWDVATDTVMWSDELFRIFQRDPADGAPSFAEHPKFYRPEDMLRLKDAVAAAVSHGTPYELELRAIRKDGATRVCLARGQAEMGPENRVARLVGSFQDINERKALEDQFRQAQKMESIGRLAGGIAHDFNNLMTVVTGYSDLARRELKGNPALLASIEEIYKAGIRASHLTRQLLAFSRKQVLKPEVMNLNGVVNDVDKLLRRLLGEDIDILFREDPDLGYVNADRGQVEQVIMNLAVNARDAMPTGGKLTIETKNVDLDAEYADRHVAITPGPYVMLAVTDTGCGMDERTKARLFEPFFTTKGAGKGTGLGLATVHGIVKQSGGNIWVYSEPGKGSTFKVYFPRVEKTGKARANQVVQGPSKGNEVILVVEDDNSVRTVILAMLAESGYQILHASDGIGALRICKEHKGEIHLLLSDVVMPGISGREFANQIRRLSPRIKVLFMSGYTDNAIQHNGILDPGVCFIEKPFSAASLTGKIREALGGA